MPRFALIGASGAIGNSIVTALAAGTETYRVVGRNAADLQRRFGHDPRAQIVTWDPNDLASARAAVRGCETLIYLVGVDYWRFDLHPVLMRATLAAARAEGCARLMLVGTVYPYGRVDHNPITEDQPLAPHTFKGRMRLAQEEALWTLHRTGDIQASILRLPDFFGPGVERSFLHGAFAAAAAGTTADLLGPIDRPHQFVYVPDVGPVLLRLAERPEAYGRAWHFGGSGVTTQSDLVAEIERQTGRPLKRRVIGKTVLRLIGLAQPLMRELVEMHYLLSDPVILDDAALETLIGPIPRTSYREAIAACLAAAAPQRKAA